MTNITNLTLLVVFMQNSTKFTYFVQFPSFYSSKWSCTFFLVSSLAIQIYAINSGVSFIWALAWYHTKDLQKYALIP